ncbi:cytochrome P450 [Polyporus arcularius HHB13444]|uniref:Cytochrome P450 n=1 Tax=Polyporus arcularius HHB13444 TaxID=1314778 RepID=A0A5C3P192_9APHY|nr:cytochrome P450 [Polyporus arcularius HHB13444]
MREGSQGQVLTLALLLLVVFLLRKFIDFRRAAQSVNNLPGFRTLFSDRFVWFPYRVKGISPGLQSEENLYRKHKDFEEAGWDIMSGVNVFPSSEVTLYLADPAVVKEVVGARSRFPKPMGPYKILLAFGPNLVASEGDEWKRQRKLVAPAFSERNNRLVWDETVHIMHDLFDNVWGNRDVVEVSNATELTVPITLMVISVAGFGRRISWNEDAIAPAGHQMTFKNALDLVSHNLFLQLLFPKWMLRWGTPLMRRFAVAQDDLQRYMQEMITARRDADIKEERHDLFSSLLDANEGLAESGEKLSDTGLMGNVFIFMVAGYESSAHTLAYALILLALYPTEQEKFYQSIKKVLADGRTPTYDEFSTLSYSMAVFNETLRLFPPAITIPKQSAEDTSFTTTNAAGEKRTIPVPKGTFVTVHTPGLHNNPKYWEDPDSFKPDRFLRDYPRDAFLPFSGGPRGCIGRGFSETESIAVLTLLIARYRVELAHEPQFAAETFEQRRARLLRSKLSVTLYPTRAPLVFKRR